MNYVSSILVLLTRTQALTLSKWTSSGVGFLSLRYLAEPKFWYFCDQPKTPRVKGRPGPVSLGGWSLAFTLTGCTETSHLEPIFLKPELPLLSKITTGASHFLPLPPLILNRHHILLCWDQLIMYCCSAPVQTAAVFSIMKTAAFWQESAELYSVAVPSSSAQSFRRA